MKLGTLLIATPDRMTDASLVVLRLGVGAVFVAHGYGDVFEAGIAANIQNYRDAGIPLAVLSAPFTALTQLIGGVLIVFGFLTRLWAAALVVVMAGALIFVHWGEPLVMNPDGSGSGFAFIMGAASLTLLLSGPGRLSVDAQVGGDRTAMRQPVG